MDVGLDEEVEGLLPPGVNLSLEFGEAVLGAAVEGGEDGHDFEFLFEFAGDLDRSCALREESCRLRHEPHFRVCRQSRTVPRVDRDRERGAGALRLGVGAVGPTRHRFSAFEAK